MEKGYTSGVALQWKWAQPVTLGGEGNAVPCSPPALVREACLTQHAVFPNRQNLDAFFFVKLASSGHRRKTCYWVQILVKYKCKVEETKGVFNLAAAEKPPWLAREVSTGCFWPWPPGLAVLGLSLAMCEATCVGKLGVSLWWGLSSGGRSHGVAAPSLTAKWRATDGDARALVSSTPCPCLCCPSPASTDRDGRGKDRLPWSWKSEVRSVCLLPHLEAQSPLQKKY